jgi:hypothetical protein
MESRNYQDNYFAASASVSTRLSPGGNEKGQHDNGAGAARAEADRGQSRSRRVLV